MERRGAPRSAESTKVAGLRGAKPLERRLGRANLAREDEVAREVAVGGCFPLCSCPMSERTSAPKAPTAKTGAETKEEAAVTSRRDQLFAARRASVSHAVVPDSGRHVSAPTRSVPPSSPEGASPEGGTSAPPARRAKSSPAILAAGAVLLVGIVIAVAVSSVGAVRRSSPQGKFQHELLMVDVQGTFGPAREAAFVALDAGPEAPKLALALLTNTDHASEGSTHSSHSYRELAAEFLLAHAAKLKAPPPPIAVKHATALRQGQFPNDGDWEALRAAWTAWLAEPGHG